MSAIIQSLIGLSGVIVGGVISYAAQTMHQSRMEKRNNKRDKHIAYNKFLLLEGRKTPLIHAIHHGEKVEFDSITYIEGIRCNRQVKLNTFRSLILNSFVTKY